MSIISETKAPAQSSSAGEKTEQERSQVPNLLEIPSFREFIFRGLDLRNFLQSMGGNLSDIQRGVWIRLSALGLLSYPTGQIKYFTEGQIAGLLGVEENALISTIEKAQLLRKVQVVEKAIVPCKIVWMDDPRFPGKKLGRYFSCRQSFWARYRGLIFVDKLFPRNQFLEPESLPEEIPISRRPYLDIPGYADFFDAEAKVGERDLLEDGDQGLALWKANSKLLRCCVGIVREMLLEECQSLPPIPALGSTREKRA